MCCGMRSCSWWRVWGGAYAEAFRSAEKGRGIASVQVSLHCNLILLLLQQYQVVWLRPPLCGLTCCAS